MGLFEVVRSIGAPQEVQFTVMGETEGGASSLFGGLTSSSFGFGGAGATTGLLLRSSRKSIIISTSRKISKTGMSAIVENQRGLVDLTVTSSLA